MSHTRDRYHIHVVRLVNGASDALTNMLDDEDRSAFAIVGMAVFNDMTDPAATPTLVVVRATPETIDDDTEVTE